MIPLGGTVAELKHRMSAAEFDRWCKYFVKHGRLGPVRMFDFGPALMCWKIDQALGGKSEIKDYLPFQDKEPEKEATVQDLLKEFGVKRGI